MYRMSIFQKITIKRKKTLNIQNNVSKSNKMEIQDSNRNKKNDAETIIAEYRYNGTGQTPPDDIDF